MEVKSIRKIIVVRMLDWAIVALVILLFLVVLVGLTTNKPISFWGLQFNMNNYNATATEPIRFDQTPMASLADHSTKKMDFALESAPLNNPKPVIQSAKPITPSNPAATKNTTSSYKSAAQTNPTPAITRVNSDENDRETERSSTTKTRQAPTKIRKSTYADIEKKLDDDYTPSASDQDVETNYSHSNNTNPYINNGTYRVEKKENPRYNNSRERGSRGFSQSEMNEFMRQFPNRKTDIHFVHFGYLDAEMESVRAQILAALNKNGYTNIDANWNKYNDYTSINEVHFGVNGYSGANFYIPRARN